MPPTNILICDFINTCVDYEEEQEGPVVFTITNSFEVPGLDAPLQPANETSNFIQANSDPNEGGKPFTLKFTFDETLNDIGLYKFEFNVFMKCNGDNCTEANDYISFIVQTLSLSSKQVTKYKEEKVLLSDIADQTKWNKRSVQIAMDNQNEALKVLF
jgi:hypothetical protein